MLARDIRCCAVAEIVRILHRDEWSEPGERAEHIGRSEFGCQDSTYLAQDPGDLFFGRLGDIVDVIHADIGDAGENGAIGSRQQEAVAGVHAGNGNGQRRSRRAESTGVEHDVCSARGAHVDAWVEFLGPDTGGGDDMTGRHVDAGAGHAVV